MSSAWRRQPSSRSTLTRPLSSSSSQTATTKSCSTTLIRLSSCSSAHKSSKLRRRVTSPSFSLLASRMPSSLWWPIESPKYRHSRDKPRAGSPSRFVQKMNSQLESFLIREIKRSMVKKNRKIAWDHKVMELRRSRPRLMILLSSSGCKRWREASKLDLHWEHRSHKG